MFIPQDIFITNISIHSFIINKDLKLINDDFSIKIKKNYSINVLL